MWITLTACVALVPLAAFAQPPPTIQWQHTYGGSNADVGFFITATSDGGYITSSTTQSNNGDVNGYHGLMDLWVIKLDAQGGIEWERCYGGSGSESSLNMVLEAPGGGYLIAGSTNSTNDDVSCPATGNRMWLARVDPQGEVLWDLCPAGSGTNALRAITPGHNGGWMVCGSTWTQEGSGCGHGQTDLWIGHVSDEGELMWSRCYGGTYSEGARFIGPTADGGYILTGATASNDGDLAGLNPWSVPPAPGGTGWVLKTDAQGEILWQHCYGGSWNENLIKAMEAEDGSYWVVGITRSNDGDVTGNHGDQDGWVLRLDTNGELMSQRCIGGSANEELFGLTLLSNGHILVAMNTNSSDGDITDPKGLHDGWVLELDPDLNIVWQHSYGGTNHEGWRSVEQSADGSAVLLGYTYSTDGHLADHPSSGSADVWILKLAPWSGTGVEDQADESEILLFPNPTTGDLQLDFGSLHGPGWQLEIMDALGRSVLTMPQVHATRGRLTIGTRGLAQGTYAVRLHKGSESYVRRFIKH